MRHRRGDDRASLCPGAVHGAGDRPLLAALRRLRGSDRHRRSRVRAPGRPDAGRPPATFILPAAAIDPDTASGSSAAVSPLLREAGRRPRPRAQARVPARLLTLLLGFLAVIVLNSTHAPSRTRRTTSSQALSDGLQVISWVTLWFPSTCSSTTAGTTSASTGLPRDRRMAITCAPGRCSLARAR